MLIYSKISKNKYWFFGKKMPFPLFQDKNILHFFYFGFHYIKMFSGLETRETDIRDNNHESNLIQIELSDHQLAR